MSNGIIGIILVAFVVGMLFGGWTTDRRWREKGRDGFRMASGGRLFTVHEDKP